MKRFERFKRHFLHALCPNQCACCGKVIYADCQLCEDCAAVLPVIEEGVCPACGGPLRKCKGDHARTRVPCISPFFYEGVVKDGLLTLKAGATAHGVGFFGRQMSHAVTNRFGHSFDGIVYVPMTKNKLRKRGYNQSRFLARAMAKYLGIPVLDGALIRLYDTDDQHGLGLRHRKGNVLGVFEPNPQLVAGKHLLLVDDIVTTGATIDECAKMLLLADCEEVCCVTAASTLLQKAEKRRG